MMRVSFPLLLIVVAPCGAAGRALLQVDVHSFVSRSAADAPGSADLQDSAAAFASFRRMHGRTYEPGSADYEDRRNIFQRNVAWIQAHNRRSDRTWTAGLNKLSDRTEKELAGLRGYRLHARSSRSAGAGEGDAASASSASVGFMGKTSPKFLSNISSFPETWSWVGNLAVTKEVMDQKSCGSCWAFATVATLRAHSELFQKDRKFSAQQIVSCVENPMKCGGDGGCEGATAELAMDYVKLSGCQTNSEFTYLAEDVTCPTEFKLKHAGGKAGSNALISELNADRNLGGKAFGMLDWRRLPSNQLAPMKQALVEQGPVAASVATYSKWNYYEQGVLDQCADDGNPAQNFIVNHAVMLVGYGRDDSIHDGLLYWQFQNSWGTDWGESGFIRIKREDDAKEAKLCDWNLDPAIGTGCSDGPSKVYVCGSCGVLYDNVIPEFELSQQGWWAKQGKKALPQKTILLAGEASVSK